MEIVSSAVIKPVAETLVALLKEHLSYMISTKKHVRDMHAKMMELDALKFIVEEHKNRNTERRLEVPAHVLTWLEEVRTTNEKVESVGIDVGTCFGLKNRYKLGKKALAIIDVIKRIREQHSLIEWTNNPIPLGRVDSIIASTSTPSSDHHNDFPSRENIFTDALKALGSDNKSHMIALCGMGGVGKTTIMKELKKVVEERRIYKYIANVVIGEKPDPISIQQTIADYLGIELKERTRSARADKLRKGFEAKQDGGKNKFLVILDDVWETVDLEDIGLSPFPNQGIDFKVLLTSRNKDVCTKMGVEANNVLNVGLLKEIEAQCFFRQFLDSFDDVDPDFHRIGEDIVKKCCGLPIAIKTMAQTLRCKRKDAWKDALLRLENHDINSVVPKVFETSYENLQDVEIKTIFLMCGLYPEDFDIPTEELVRYGWGLKTFKHVYTIREARSRLNTCIGQLINTNLLLESDDGGCVKMHDLVRAFVLDMFSKVDHASLVNLGSLSGWPENDLNDSCKRISLTCKGMSEFPSDLKFPNLLFLKLMHGHWSLRFPQDFYEEMTKLQVISYDNMTNPLLPLSLQCSTNLRVLHFHKCSLVFDCSSIGKLLNLEVLSFANSGIKWLPSTIGNLKKLRLLDLSNCAGLRVDDGVLKNLVKLEEIYAIVSDTSSSFSYREHEISFTDDDWNEMAKRSKNLSALEFEFCESNALLKNMSFKNLERFTISVGRSLDARFRNNTRSFENTLQLVTNKGELLESKMNELFDKTEVLNLSVDDMDDLEDIEVKPLRPPQSSSFYNLRYLVVSKCGVLRYLFTAGVAKAFTNLEHLQVHTCDNMETLIYTEDGGEETIRFPKLNFLSLCGLAKLSGLCNNVNIIQLPQLVSLNLEDLKNFTSIYPRNKLATSSFFSEEVVIPELQKLCISRMEDLEELWPCESSISEEVKLKKIEVRSCGQLVNLFPRNPMPLLHHLEELKVLYCGSIKMLFNIDMDCLNTTGEGSTNSIRSIKVWYCHNILFLFPCNPMPLMNHLEELQVLNCRSIEALFDIDLDCIGKFGEGRNSSTLRSIKVKELGKLREVWRIKGVDTSCLLISGFQAVESIIIETCKSFRNLCTPTTINFDLGALMDIKIIDLKQTWGDKGDGWSYSIELASREEAEIGIVLKEEASQVIDIKSNMAFPSFLIHSLHNLHTLVLKDYKGVQAVFEIESPTSRELITTHHNQQPLLPYLVDLKLRRMYSMSCVWKCNWNKFLIFQKQQSESAFYNLTTINIDDCQMLKYLFSPLMAKLLCNLKKVEIEDCYDFEEVVSNRDDEDEEKTTFISTISTQKSTTLFPHLDSLTLSSLRNLKCIGGGGAKDGNNKISTNTTTTATPFIDQYKFPQMGGVSWTLCQYAREISIKYCDALSSVIPCSVVGQMKKLQVLNVTDCKSMKEVFETEGMDNNNNGFIEGNGGKPEIPRLNNVIVLPNLKILNIEACVRLEHIFTFSTLESLRQLEELTIKLCWEMKVIVKKEDGGEQSKEVVVFPRLKSIVLVSLPKLVGFFLGKNEFKWPSLDKVTIKECPKMMVFTPGGSSTPVLKFMETSVGKHNIEECGLNHHLTTNSHHQTLFPNSHPASLEGMPWSFQYFIESHVTNSFVGKIIPSNQLLHLQKMEKIYVKSCNYVKWVFEALEAGKNSSDSDESSKTTLVKLPNLKQVELYELSGLRHMWKSNNWIIFEFPNLTRVSIGWCERLEHAFTTSMVCCLLQLQELIISHCENMEEVIVKDAIFVLQAEEEEESGGKMNEMMFPCLKSLALNKLPHLKGFWFGKKDFSFPLLNTLTIRSCPTTVIFSKGSSRNWLQNLEEILIENCLSVEEVFEAWKEGTNSSIGFDESQTTLLKLPNLRQVELKSLDSLRHIWKRNQWTIFEFPNLTTLSISECHKLEHVFTSSMVGSLLQLQKLSMSRCNHMEEVIVEDTNVIVE